MIPMACTLYLLVGPPGSGKTTAASIIAEASGAEHIWVDHERAAMFDRPTHSQAESRQLYQQLNHKAATLLGQGKSVVFDTNFNHWSDRELMRQIADKAGATVKIIQLTTDQELAQVRAMQTRHARRNQMPMPMSGQTFTNITNHYEPLRAGEDGIKIDGRDIDRVELLTKLGLQ
jgi:predicted kinase